MHSVQIPPDRFPVLAILIAIAAGLLVWHAPRANQARLGIRSRRGQIRGMRGEIRTFALRGVVLLIVFILLMVVARSSRHASAAPGGRLLALTARRRDVLASAAHTTRSANDSSTPLAA